MKPAEAPSPRVCTLLESYVPVVGGMETQARNLIQALSERGVQQIVVTRRTSADLAREETVDGVPVYRVGPVGPRRRARWAMVRTALPELIRRRREYDILFVPGFRTLGIPAVLAGRWLGKRTILKAESSGEMSGAFFSGGLEQANMRRSNWLVRLALALRNRLLVRADAFVSMSSELTEEFRAGGVQPDKNHLIPQTVDVARFRPVSPEQKAALRARLGLPPTDRLAIFTGRLVSYKGLPVLVRVWEDICRMHDNARLVVVGSGGVDAFNCEEALHRSVDEHGLAGHVLFTGARSNVEEYLQASDLFVFPTENEAFGISLIEAMACGLPVISTTIGGIKDILSDGENGLVVPPGDGDALRAAVLRLLDHPELGARMGAAALQTVQTRYTREIVTAQYLELFRHMRAS